MLIRRCSAAQRRAERRQETKTCAGVPARPKTRPAGMTQRTKHALPRLMPVPVPDQVLRIAGESDYQQNGVRKTISTFCRGADDPVTPPRGRYTLHSVRFHTPPIPMFILRRATCPLGLSVDCHSICRSHSSFHTPLRHTHARALRQLNR